MDQINTLDLGYVGDAVSPSNPEFVRGCLGCKFTIANTADIVRMPSNMLWAQYDFFLLQIFSFRNWASPNPAICTLFKSEKKSG